MEVVVRYAWHPWVGMSVILVRTVRKQPESVLYVECDRELGAKLREIPGWMIDPAVCAVMRLAVEPIVSLEAIRALRDLVQCVGAALVIERGRSRRVMETVVESGPPLGCGPAFRGDTDVTPTLARPSAGPARPLSVSTPEAALGDVSGRDPGGITSTACPAVEATGRADRHSPGGV